MSYTQEQLDNIWKKAEPKGSSGEWKKDFAGAWIRKNDYGKETSYGWQVDHRKPESKGGSDDLSNLFPMHWENNRKKSDNYPNFQTSISSDGNKNIPKIENWKVS